MQIILTIGAWLGLYLAASTTAADELPVCPKGDAKNALYGAQCGSIALAANPQDENSASIDVYILRLPSIRNSDKPPIFFIAGGPGQASTDLAAQFRYQFKDLLVDHDFIFVDQRGTGKSNALECDVEFLPHLDKSTAQIEEIALKESRKCLANNDVDLRRYTTPYAVQDLEAVRKHLGYERIFLWGGSYGTRVVLEYLRSFPQSLAGVIMDGLAPVAIALPNYTEQDANAALDKLLSHCEQTKACQQAFPDLRSRWLNTLTRLAETPALVDLKHPRSGEMYRVYIDDTTLSSWIRLILYSREVVALVPLMMQQSTQQDYSTLFSIVSTAYENINKQFSELMQSAILCAEDNTVGKTLSPVEENNNRLLRLPSKENFEKLCAMFPASEIEEAYFDIPKREVPALLLSGRYDPVTPARWAELSAKSLSRSQHIRVPGGHHIVSSLGCVSDLIADFVAKPNTIGELDDSCVANIKPADFFIDPAGPAMEASND